MNKKTIYQQPPKNSNIPEKKPNETMGFYFSSKLKIFDPVTGVVFLQKRGDN